MTEMLLFDTRNGLIDFEQALTSVEISVGDAGNLRKPLFVLLNLLDDAVELSGMTNDAIANFDGVIEGIKFLELGDGQLSGSCLAVLDTILMDLRNADTRSALGNELIDPLGDFFEREVTAKRENLFAEPVLFDDGDVTADLFDSDFDCRLLPSKNSSYNIGAILVGFFVDFRMYTIA